MELICLHLKFCLKCISSLLILFAYVLPIRITQDTVGGSGKERKSGGSSTLLEMLYKAWFNFAGEGGEQIFKIVLQHAYFKR